VRNLSEQGSFNRARIFGGRVGAISRFSESVQREPPVAKNTGASSNLNLNLNLNFSLNLNLNFRAEVQIKLKL
jgi:hypothetical protein